MRGRTVTYDIETCGLNDTSGMVTAIYGNEPDPYAGLNRAQRRKAMSVERRAARKGLL